MLGTDRDEAAPLLAGSHSIYISQPQAVAALIKEAARLANQAAAML